MIHRRGVVTILMLIGLMLFGVLAQTLASAVPQVAAGARRPAPATTAKKTAAPAVPRPTAGVVDALARAQNAFNAGDVVLLCKSGALVDPAVVRSQNAQGGCENELETLVANEAPMRLTVQQVTTNHDLAMAVVTTRPGTTATVDLVRDGSGWLLSFSDGNDPLPALAGTA
jgi:S1-C subfamily serine protease